MPNLKKVTVAEAQRAALRAATRPLTREEWLTRATVALSEKFFPLADGRTRMPEKWACSCGFPYKSREAIGQCWPPTVSGVSPKQLEEHGAPRDPWGDEMVPAGD